MNKAKDFNWTAMARKDAIEVDGLFVGWRNTFD